MTEVDALIVRNIKELDGAAAHLKFDLQEQVGRVLNQVVETWSEKEGWKGIFDWYGKEDDIWVAAPSWRGENEEDELDYDFWFALAAGEGRASEGDRDGDQFWLTALCRAGRGTLGFVSHQDEYRYPKGRKWKAKIEPYLTELLKLGFVYEDKTGQIFLPISVDQEQLAKAIEAENLYEALDQIAVTLGRLTQAVPIINQLRAGARKIEVDTGLG